METDSVVSARLRVDVMGRTGLQKGRYSVGVEGAGVEETWNKEEMI